jgi:proteasome assembly chaperone (PAC2) family protein
MRWLRRSGGAAGGSGRRAGQVRGALRLREVPKLRSPVVVVSFEGWNDAGDGASTAAAFLARTWNARPFGEIDPEEFVDFTDTRPEVRIVEGETRETLWPSTSLSAASPAGAPRDVVLLRGHEPHLRWRTYCSTVVEAVRIIGAEHVVTLGALLAEVPHTRPVPVSASATDRRIVEKLGLARSRYEGPTGIVGVLHSALAESGVPSTTLWASVPYYVPQITSAKAALALVATLERLLEFPVDTTELEKNAAEYEREVDELVAADEDIAAYVARLEEMGEEPDDDGVFPDIAAEAERFLRDHRRR